MSKNLKKVENIVREALLSRGFRQGEVDQIIYRLENKVEEEQDPVLSYENRVLPFGKYKGWDIGRVPISYINWLSMQDWFEDEYPYLYETAENILNKYFG